MMPRNDRLRLILDFLTTIAVLAASIGTAFVVLSRPRSSAKAELTSEASSARNGIQSIAGLTIRPPSDANIRGRARWAIVEFSDFQCPYCGRYFNSTYTTVQQHLVDTGMVEYVFINFPLESIHPRALEAGEAVMCAGAQGRFWQMHDRLFKNQQALQHVDLIKYAEALKLDIGRFDQCLSHEAGARIAADRQLGTSVGVTGTPTLFVGEVLPDGAILLRRRLSGAASFDAVQQAVFDVVPPVGAPHGVAIRQ